MTGVDRALVAAFALTLAGAVLLVPGFSEGVYVLLALTAQTIRETVALAAGTAP